MASLQMLHPMIELRFRHVAPSDVRALHLHIKHNLKTRGLQVRVRLRGAHENIIRIRVHPDSSVDEVQQVIHETVVIWIESGEIVTRPTSIGTDFEWTPAKPFH